MTKSQQTFLQILDEYRGIADNGNIMAETVWPRSKILAVGRSLMKLNLVCYTSTQMNGFEGGVWRRLCVNSRPADTLAPVSEK